MPVAFVVTFSILGCWSGEVKLFGPAHSYLVAAGLVTDVNCSVCPEQSGVLACTVILGNGFTITSTVSPLTQLFFVTVKKYFPASVRAALAMLNEEEVLRTVPAEFFHWYWAPVPAF